MSGARNYLALVVMFPEGTEAQLALGGLEPREIHFREVVVDVAAVGRSTDEVLRIMTEHMEPEEHPKPRKAAIDQRLGDLKRLGQDVTGERLRKHGERIAELESSVRDLEVGRGPHQVAREEFGGLSMHVDQLARSLAAVEEKLELLSFATTSTPTPVPAEPSQAPIVEPESGAWIETVADGTKPWPEEWGAPPLPCMLVVRAGRELAGVVALRDRRFRDAYVAGFARCRELDPRGRDTAAYKAEDLAGERAAQHVVEDLQGLSSGGVFAFLTAAREAIRAKRAGEGS